MDEKKFCVKNQEFSLVLTKRSYLEWYEVRGVTRIRHKIYGGINRQKTDADKITFAKELARGIMSDQIPDVRGSLLLRTLEKYRSLFREKTYQSKKSRVRMFLIWLNGKPDGSVTQKDVNEFILYCFNQGKAPATIKSYINSIAPLYRRAGMDPFKDCMKFKVQSTSLMYFNDDQARRIVNYCREHYPVLYIAINVLHFCFLRPTYELRMLKFKNIDFENRLIRINKEYSKNGKPDPVVIPDPLFEILKPYRNYDPDLYLFGRHKIGVPDPIGKNYFNRIHSKVLSELNINGNYAFYSWKDTGALALVKAGIHVKFIQKQMRHFSLDMTDKYLSNLTASDSIELRNLKPL